MAADINEPVQRGFLEQMAEASQARAAIAEVLAMLWCLAR